MSQTLSARGYSEEEVERIENIIDNSQYLESKSDFIRTTSQYALFKSIEWFEPTVENFKEKVNELGLDDEMQLYKLNYFDTLTSAYTLADDPDVSDSDYREIIEELAEERLQSDFSESSFVENVLE